MPPTNVAAEFYDGFATKLLSDFCCGNPRIESALQFASNQLIARDSRRVLDLGFGLGWSSYEFSRALSRAEILGLDLSPRLATLASAMFGSGDRLRYLCQDLTDPAWRQTCTNSYDACVMLDVYEHVPRGEREAFHRALASVLTEDAVMVLACPTPLHQDFLRKNQPEGLQPVDEDVTFDDLVSLAAAIGGVLVHLEHKSVWSTNDYFHAVISKRLHRGAVERFRSHELIGRRSRHKHLERAVDIVGHDVVAQLKASTVPMHGRIIHRVRELVRTYV